MVDTVSRIGTSLVERHPELLKAPATQIGARAEVGGVTQV